MLGRTWRAVTRGSPRRGRAQGAGGAGGRPAEQARRGEEAASNRRRSPAGSGGSYSPPASRESSGPVATNTTTVSRASPSTAAVPTPVAGLALVLVWLATAWPVLACITPGKPAGLASASVERVGDGDTMRLRFPDGRRERTRLIGPPLPGPGNGRIGTQTTARVGRKPPFRPRQRAHRFPSKELTRSRARIDDAHRSRRAHGRRARGAVMRTDRSGDLWTEACLLRVEEMLADARAFNAQRALLRDARSPRRTVRVWLGSVLLAVAHRLLQPAPGPPASE